VYCDNIVLGNATCNPWGEAEGRNFHNLMVFTGTYTLDPSHNYIDDSSAI
jgi:hypothetical protein